VAARFPAFRQLHHWVYTSLLRVSLKVDNYTRDIEIKLLLRGTFAQCSVTDKGTLFRAYDMPIADVCAYQL